MDRANNSSANIAICQGSRHEQQHTNMMPEADRAEKVDIKDKLMVHDKEPNTTNYFLPCSTKIMIKL